MDPVMAARVRVDAFSRANYLGAVANRVDSYWVPDHINGQTPRPLWDPKYTASARLLRSPDAAMEAWTLLGSLAALQPGAPRCRCHRHRQMPPRRPRASVRDPESDDPRARDPRYRALRRGLVEAVARFRGGARHHPRT